MKTFSAKPGQIEQGWYVVDLAGQHVGRAAATVASILRGKHRPIRDRDQCRQTRFDGQEA